MAKKATKGKAAGKTKLTAHDQEREDVRRALKVAGRRETEILRLSRQLTRAILKSDEYLIGMAEGLMERKRRLEQLGDARDVNGG